MRIGISGLAMGNSTGLGRLSRIYLLALARCAPEAELHLYLRAQQDLELLRQECDQRTAWAMENVIPHYAPYPQLNRLVLEEWDLPRRFQPLHLNAYLGCDFTLPPRQLAEVEAVVVPDLIPFTNPATVSWRARWLYRRGIRRSLQRRARMLCISRHTQQALCARFPAAEEHSCVVYPALSPRLWQLAQQQRHGDHPLQVRGSLYPLVDPGRYILSVAVLGPRKNTELLVRVYRTIVLNHEYQGSLVLAGGDGRFHTAPAGQAFALQPIGAAPAQHYRSAEVHDLGRVSDVDLSQLYANADLLVSLSTEEGFGYPVLEALAHGTPALVTAGSSMTEIAHAGLATTPLGPEACRRSLTAALGSCHQLRQAAARLPVGDYAIERLGHQLLDLLAGV